MNRHYLRAPAVGGQVVVKVGPAPGGVRLEVDGRQLNLTPGMARGLADALHDQAEDAQ